MREAILLRDWLGFRDKRVDWLVRKRRRIGEVREVRYVHYMEKSTWWVQEAP